jgi:CspA family cold shock protein
VTGPGPIRDRHHGVVTAFDEQRGLGEVVADDGVRYGFHCTEIADGTRTVAVGTRVRFRSLPKLGRWEAADLRPA